MNQYEIIVRFSGSFILSGIQAEDEAEAREIYVDGEDGVDFTIHSEEHNRHEITSIECVYEDIPICELNSGMKYADRDKEVDVFFINAE